MEHVIVRPVIELNVNFVIPPLNTSGGKLAAEIKAQAISKGYSQYSSDGWYVPLSELISKIEAVADYLLFEASYWHEFEITGGFEIVTHNGVRVGVTPGSVFHDALTLAAAVDNLKGENKTRRAFIENDRYLDLTLHHDEIGITTGHRARHINQIGLTVSARELKSGMIEARQLLQQFAGEIGPLLIRSTDVNITPQLIKRMFGAV